LTREKENSFDYKKFLILIAILLTTIAVDITLVKVYDLVNKSFIQQQTKLLLFCLNTSICLFVTFNIIKYLEKSFKRIPLKRTYNIESLYRISLYSLFGIGTLVGLLIFQQLYNGYYSISITIFIIAISYGTAAGFMARLTLLFITWFKSNRNWVVFLYSASMLMITFNLVMTAVLTDAKLTVRPDLIREFFGGSMNLTLNRFTLIENIYTVSSVMAFASIWITTALLINLYRERLINAIWYWVILTIPLFYFLLNNLFKFILTNFVVGYMTIDPVAVSVTLTLFLSLSKPIGGLTFALAFWKISKVVGYEKNIKSYMIITGWGIFLIYGTDQALLQTVTPYPPFGIATVTVMILAAFMMLLGVYNSAALVSANATLRNSVLKNAPESIFLGKIGRAEMQKEVQKTVRKVYRLRNQIEVDTDQTIEFDEKGLEDYVSFLAKEVKKSSIKDPPEKT